MDRKPRTYGATPIRVVVCEPGKQTREAYFYDAKEAVKFCQDNWNGREISARVYDGTWAPIYTIREDGEQFASPLYEQVIRNATVSLGNIKEATP
jgi:hypothetical protein